MLISSFATQLVRKINFWFQSLIFQFEDEDEGEEENGRGTEGGERGQRERDGQ